MGKKIRIFISILIPLVIALFFYASFVRNTRGGLNYQEYLDKVAVVVDGEEITLSDLRFYILFEENKIEEQAKLYNPDNTRDYWNTHTNGIFLQAEAKEAVLGMAIHDKIMYNGALEHHIVMGPDEKEALEEARTRFWGSIYESQLEKLPLSYEEGNAKIADITLAESYQRQLAKEMKTSVAGLNWDGYDYKELLNSHTIKINNSIWDRIVLGNISLDHKPASFINGLTDEEIRQIQEKK